MSNLMTDNYTYESLQTKYGNFRVPKVKILIDGNDILEKQRFQIYEIQVILSLTAASCTVIKIMNAYDLKNQEYDDTLKEKFKLGTIIEIELGYLTETTKIFKGFVSMIGAEFGKIPLFCVTCMDARRLMMISGCKYRLHDVKKYSDAFQKIMDSYKKLCSVEIDATEEELERPISQTTTDYDFVIKELVPKTEREFFILYDKAYFRKKPQTDSAMMQIELGRELLEFQMNTEYIDMQIEIVGYDSTKQTTISAKKEVKTKDAMSSLFTKTPIFTISDADTDSQKKAITRVEAIARNELDRAKSGHGVCIGLPEFVPGRFMEVVKTEKFVNRVYYISEVRHSYTDNFFTTEFEIGSWL